MEGGRDYVVAQVTTILASVIPTANTATAWTFGGFRSSSFGKASITVRLIAQSLFIAQAMLRSLFVPGVSAVLVSTSPPFAGFAGAILAWCRRVPFAWWVMDLNPDQMVVVGKLAQRAVRPPLFDWMNAFTLERAAAVIALDAFMAERLLAKHDCRQRLHVIPPWAHEIISRRFRIRTTLFGLPTASVIGLL